MSGMTLGQLISRTRSHTRDLSGTVFTNQHIQDFINEGINRIRMVIPELRAMPLLYSGNETVKLLPLEYQHLIALYSSSRCFFQDDRFFQATTYMNEFEVKLDEMKSRLHSGDLVILGEDGNAVTFKYFDETVNLKPYWGVDEDPEFPSDFFDVPTEE